GGRARGAGVSLSRDAARDRDRPCGGADREWHRHSGGARRRAPRFRLAPGTSAARPATHTRGSPGVGAGRSARGAGYATAGWGIISHSVTTSSVVRSWRAGSVAYHVLKYSRPVRCASSVNAWSASVTHTRSYPR